MSKIVGVRFRDVGKIYYFYEGKEAVKHGDKVIVQTARGLECGSVTTEKALPQAKKNLYNLKKIIRKATPADLRKLKENQKKCKEAFKICEKKILAHKLDMKLIDVECIFDNSKLLFYFTADGRVDFRALVKDLASVFRTRIELRQVGVRDEARMLGGLGICGKPFCCSTFLDDFQPVSIKMAKEQNLSLNPTKISGTCGRLMCCLKFEHEAYRELLEKTPKVGALVDTPEGKATVIDLNLLTGKLTLQLKKSPDAAPLTMNVKDVKLIKDGKLKLDKAEIARLKRLEE